MYPCKLGIDISNCFPVVSFGLLNKKHAKMTIKANPLTVPEVFSLRYLAIRIILSLMRLRLPENIAKEAARELAASLANSGP